MVQSGRIIQASPAPKEKPHKDNGVWKKVPAHMEDLFGKPYLTEEEWMISL